MTLCVYIICMWYCRVPLEIMEQRETWEILEEWALLEKTYDHTCNSTCRSGYLNELQKLSFLISDVMC